MAKYLLAVCMIMCTIRVAIAQQATHSFFGVNPFKNMEFVKCYKDTATLNVIYTGEHGPLSTSNLVTLNQIEKLHDINIGRFRNSMEFSIPDVNGKFYVPYSSSSQSAVATAKPNTPLKLKCTVFRFFTIDGICNFFCVDKVLL